MLTINDIHIGFDRKSGVTPASQKALRTYLFQAFEDLLDSTEERHLVIAGDLFDSFEVESRDLLQTYNILQEWLSRVPTDRRLTLIAGNHDHSAKGDRVSSFELLASILKEQFLSRVDVVAIDQWALVRDGIYALAYCSSQEIFDAKLVEVLEAVKMGDRVLLHANFDNKFTAESDHSLNVSVDVAKQFASKGAGLIFAHEHQARTAVGGTVTVLGNQFPTSIADCLNNDAKYAHILNGGVVKVETWAATGTNGFSLVDWRELSLTDTQAKFIRVTGDASAAEASEVINAIAKFRKNSEAFIVGNSVKIDGLVQAEALPESFEAQRAFDVLDFISKHLDEKEMVAVRELQGEMQ